jgi:hypothetical protein
MTNSDAGGEVMSELLRAISAEYDWPDFRPLHRTTAPIDASRLLGFAGDYRGDRGWAVTVTHESGRLFVLAPPFGSARVELLHAGGGDFFTQTAPLTFRFADDKQSVGKVDLDLDQALGVRLTHDCLLGLISSRCSVTLQESVRRLPVAGRMPASRLIDRRTAEARRGQVRHGRPRCSNRTARHPLLGGLCATGAHNAQTPRRQPIGS